MKTINNISKKALLVILDGYGINPSDNKNAVKHANTPHLDYLFSNYPYTTIEAGGVSVGLPKGVPGNSEVGHMNLGAGRPVKQDLVSINESIDTNTLKDMELFKDLISKAKSNNNSVHLMGLLSDGGVHSHIDHLKHIANLLNQQNIKIYLHAFMDGRDTAPNVGCHYLEEIKQIPYITIASIQGRSIGMDRDRRWEKIELAYKTMIGTGNITKLSPAEYLQQEYQSGTFDEFITPALFDPNFAITNHDSLFFFNFRPDRAIQITLAMTQEKFSHFPRKITPAHFLCMTPYVPEEVELPILFEKGKITGGMSEYLAKIGKKQIKIAETEKYAHVTYFFNGGEKNPFKGEEHILIDSPKEVATYDQKPEMSAFEVTKILCKKIEEDHHDFYLVNLANSDMVGHTGNYTAAVQAVETLDKCVQEFTNICQEKGLTLVVTADHGNSDQMIYDDGTPHTSHTGALVPFVIKHSTLKNSQWEINNKNHSLMDVAPTLLSIMGINIPKEFQGQPIFK